MATSRPRAPVLALTVASSLGLACSLAYTSSQSCEPDSLGGKVTAVITTERNAYAVGTSIRAKVHVSNLSDCTLYVLKESWSGPVWKDRLGKRFVIAHDAFTAARQEQLWGGGTLLEIYRPEFYEVAPGQQRTLRWDLGDAIESGTWRLEGRISTLLDVAPFSGLQGTAAAEAIAKTDVVIPCLGKTIVIDGAAER